MYIRRLIFVFIYFSLSQAFARSPMENFKNPALQFVGIWEVTRYDFRDFLEIPEDLDIQLKENAAAFPVGMRIKFKWTGSSIMPGSINPNTMEGGTPSGEVLAMTLLFPYIEKLCLGYWDYICHKNKNYGRNVMIAQIEKWDDEARNALGIWSEIEPVEYGFADLGRSFSFNVWIARKGDIVFPIYLKGRGKNGSKFGLMGIFLRKIE